MKSYEFKKIKGNLALLVAVVIILGGYAFFFTSTTWLPANLSAKLETQLLEDIEWANRIVNIRRWDYCPTSETMEIELDVDNKAYDGINNYQISAASRSKSSHEVEKIIEEPNWIIVRIPGVSNNFGEVSLRISADIPDVETLKLYTNVNVVNLVDSLEQLDRKGYKNKRTEAEIQGYVEVNTKANEDIENLKQKNILMQQDIKTLGSNKKYLTDVQKAELQNQLHNIQQQIATNNEEIQNQLKIITENNKRIELLKKQLIQ